MRDLPPPLLYDIAYFLLKESATLYKEQAESMEKVDSLLSGLVFEEETGLPPIARLFPPADASAGERVWSDDVTGGMPPL